MAKSLAQICKEDKQIMKNTWRPGVKRPIRPIEMKREMIADSFRVEGYLKNRAKNRGTSRETQAKRGI